MLLSELIQELPILEFRGKDCEIKGLTTDSRQVKEGYLFIAEKGLTSDGHSFAGAAKTAGAPAIITERILPLNITQVLVSSTTKAAGFLASRFYGNPASQMRMIGITGTKGKTTTGFLLHFLLHQKMSKPALLGSVCFKVGDYSSPSSYTTLPALLLQEKLKEAQELRAQTMVLEVSSHALSQRRVADIDFDVAVFTNFSRDHLDFHKTMEEYLKAKTLLFSRLGNYEKGLKGRNYAVINGDDVVATQLEEITGVPVFTYGTEAHNHYRAEGIKLFSHGSEFWLRTPWGDEYIKLPLPGRFNVYNALAAVAVAHQERVSLKVIAMVLPEFTGVPGRFQKVEADLPFQVIIDYAHTEESLRQAILTAREFTSGRVLLLFGCTGDRDKGKRPLMGRLALELADKVIVTSDDPYSEDPDSIIDQIYAQIPYNQKKMQRITQRPEAVKEILNMAEKGDTVILAGKGHEQYQIFSDHIVPYSDAAAVDQWLKQRNSEEAKDE